MYIVAAVPNNETTTTATPPPTISIENSVFEKNVYENPVASVMNIFEGVLMARVQMDDSPENVSDVHLNIKGLLQLFSEDYILNRKCFSFLSLNNFWRKSVLFMTIDTPVTDFW